MRMVFLIILCTALLIGMFYKLDHGAAQDKLLSEQQRAKLKDVMKPQTLGLPPR